MDYAKSKGLPVIMHSCGYVEPLLPGMTEAGIDIRTLYTNDKAITDKELESKISLVKECFGYFLHSDHSIPKTVNYETYRYFIKRGLELGTY